MILTKGAPTDCVLLLKKIQVFPVFLICMPSRRSSFQLGAILIYFPVHTNGQTKTSPLLLQSHLAENY